MREKEKCRFGLVDVKYIDSAEPRENFDPEKIEKLADSILDCGLLRPMLLKQDAPEHFIVLFGHLEYWAAVRAREKNPRKGEMVNAFVTQAYEDTMLRQLAIYR